MPHPLELPEGVYKGEDGRWYRSCTNCGSSVNHLRRNYCIGAHNTKQPCKRCSNINNHPSGMVGSVRVAWYEGFKKSALTRGYSWNITPEFLDAMYNEQDGLCVYSGLPIYWSSQGWDHTASIDRINNSIGYEEGNVQLVHKEINMMRGSLTDLRFKELCRIVSNHI